MKQLTCQHCGKGIEGTARRKYCDSSCRCQHWRDVKRAATQATRGEIESAQFHVYAGILKLEEGLKRGDPTALNALAQVDKMLNRISMEMR